MAINNLLSQIQQEFDQLQTLVSKSEKLDKLHPISEVATLIRREREVQGLTRQDLSDLCGVSMTTLAKIEGGSGDVRLESILLAVRALGMNLWIA